MFNPHGLLYCYNSITLEGSPSSGKDLWMPDIHEWHALYTYGMDCSPACTRRISSSFLSVITFGWLYFLLCIVCCTVAGAYQVNPWYSRSLQLKCCRGLTFRCIDYGYRAG